MTPQPSPNGGEYAVHHSAAIAKEFVRLQRRASEQGKGEVFLHAAREAIRRMRRDPMVFGEPLYRLPALRLQLRCAVIRPLVVGFAVSEERREVYIKAVKLL
jgi:hypothetical protein